MLQLQNSDPSCQWSDSVRYSPLRHSQPFRNQKNLKSSALLAFIRRYMRRTISQDRTLYY